MRDLGQLEGFLNQRLLGQAEAVAEFAAAIIRAERGPERPHRPRALLLLLGPTGTGKTELVQLTAQALYGAGTTARFARFDMGEFQHRDAIQRLLGGPDQPALLGRAIDRLNAAGGGLLLLDEIEKAFPDLLTLLLSFDSARSTMADGVTRDLSRLLIVLTSNLGAADAARMEHAGYSAVLRRLRYAAEQRFGKEGVARFSAVICTTVLSYPVQVQITAALLAYELAAQSRHLHRQVLATAEVVPWLVSRGYSADLGARALRNAVERGVGDALRPYLLAAAPAPAGAPDRWADALELTVDADDRLVAVPLARVPAAR